MEDPMAYCGLVCTECPAYQGTQAGDDELLERTARMWSEAFGEEITPESIRCDGCKSEGGTRSLFCGMCKVRECNIERGYDNCAPCPDYICDKLAEFLKMAPEAGAKLEELRGG
jgi:hypothetical protein